MHGSCLQVAKASQVLEKAFQVRCIKFDNLCTVSVSLYPQVMPAVWIAKISCALQAERNVVDAISQCQVSTTETHSSAAKSARAALASDPRRGMCIAGHLKSADFADVAADKQQIV